MSLRIFHRRKARPSRSGMNLVSGRNHRLDVFFPGITEGSSSNGLVSSDRFWPLLRPPDGPGTLTRSLTLVKTDSWRCPAVGRAAIGSSFLSVASCILIKSLSFVVESRTYSTVFPRGSVTSHKDPTAADSLLPNPVSEARRRPTSWIFSIRTHRRSTWTPDHVEPLMKRCNCRKHVQ